MISHRKHTPAAKLPCGYLNKQTWPEPSLCHRIAWTSQSLPLVSLGFPVETSTSTSVLLVQSPFGAWTFPSFGVHKNHSKGFVRHRLRGYSPGPSDFDGAENLPPGRILKECRFCGRGDHTLRATTEGHQLCQILSSFSKLF